MIHYVYILYSASTNAFYKGQTNDLTDRIRRHNAGMEDFSKKGIPWLIIWSTVKSSRQEAVSLERKLKNLSKSRLFIFISKYNSGLHISWQAWTDLRGS